MRMPLATALLALCTLSTAALAHFETGQVYVSDIQNSKVYRVNVDNGVVNTTLTAADGLNGASAIGFSLHGHMLVSNFYDNSVIEFDAGLNSEVVLTNANGGIAAPFGGNGIIIGPGHGDVFVANLGGSPKVLHFDEDYNFIGTVLDASDGLVNPTAMAFLPDGGLLVANRSGNNELFHITEDGVVSIYTSLTDINPASMVVRDNGDVYIVSTRGDLYRMVGADPNNMVLLGNFGGPLANHTLGFTPDYTELYHTNSADGIFRTIDPDTGASTIITTIVGSPSAMIVVGSHFPHGTFAEFGESLAGAGEIEPTLHGHGEPRIGDPATVEMHSFVGGTQVFLFLSAIAGESSLFGGEFHIQLGPSAILLELTATGAAGVAGDGDVDLPFVIPNDPAIVGIKFFMQALGVDAAAPQGVSMTNCLTMFVGDSE
ncbi:MAG: hypothetical protein ACI9EF_000841 [Pseudohongiellaceae bacterium]|jgi:hypothetical protein